MHWMDYYGGSWRWGMGFGWIGMLLFWILVFLGVIYLVKLLMAMGKEKQGRENALEILKNRYAKGEISEDEFKKKKKDILE